MVLAANARESAAKSVAYALCREAEQSGDIGFASRNEADTVGCGHPDGAVAGKGSWEGRVFQNLPHGFHFAGSLQKRRRCPSANAIGETIGQGSNVGQLLRTIGADLLESRQHSLPYGGPVQVVPTAQGFEEKFLQ